MSKKSVAASIIGVLVISLVALFSVSRGSAEVSSPGIPSLMSLVLVKEGRLSDRALPRDERLTLKAIDGRPRRSSNKKRNERRLLTLDELSKLVSLGYGKDDKARQLPKGTLVDNYKTKTSVVEAFLKANSREAIYQMKEVIARLETSKLFDEKQVTQWRGKYLTRAEEGVR